MPASKQRFGVHSRQTWTLSSLPSRRNRAPQGWGRQEPTPFLTTRRWKRLRLPLPVSSLAGAPAVARTKCSLRALSRDVADGAPDAP
eukprot:8501242-Pyramimonas_sp.AAC.1